MSETIKKLTIEGFKSIRKLEDFELRPLNVLIGANGAGKSNFVEFFRLLRELVEQRLQVAIATAGGPDACLYLGQRITRRLVAKLHFPSAGYEFTLAPTADDRLVFDAELAVIYRGGEAFTRPLGSGHFEARVKDRKGARGVWEQKRAVGIRAHGAPYDIYEAVSSSAVYHFHDTSAIAGVRRQGAINDDEYLRPNADNLAAFLHRLQHTHLMHYTRIRDVVRLAAPFFHDFQLRPVTTNPELIQLEWLQKDSDYPFRPSQLSDGTLRFICLATALLQPSPPATMVFDEPELGLHPYALSLLGSLLEGAAKRTSQQVIVSTQSAQLLNEFPPENVIAVERTRGESVFRRLDSAQLSQWLEEYTLGELWQKNVLGGGPQNEAMPLPFGADANTNEAPEREPTRAGDERR